MVGGVRERVGTWAMAVVAGAQARGLRPPASLRTQIRAIDERLSARRSLRLPAWSSGLVGDRAVPATDPAPKSAEIAVPALGQEVLHCLLVTSCLDAGGMDEVVAFLARHMPARGVAASVLHATSPESPRAAATYGRLAEQLAQEGTNVASHPESTGVEWIRRLSPDVISAHGAPAWVLDAAKRLSIPYVEVIHGMHHFIGADWAAEARRARDVTAFVAVSTLVREEYLSGNPRFPQDRIITIPNSVDLERKSAADRLRSRSSLGLTDEFVFVSLARHCLQKNSFALVDAFDEVAGDYPTAHLVVSGRADDSRYVARMLARRDRSPHKARIHIRDHHPDPAGLLAAADGFVQNSFFEGWSLASMEALCLGVPVIVSEVGGAREQLAGRPERGYLIPNPTGSPSVSWDVMGRLRYVQQPNRAALVKAMRCLISEHPERLAMRHDIAHQARRDFAPQLSADRHARALEWVCAGMTAPLTGVDG
jgi:glycosyltransferase involved in cell wall biosynthesis